MTVTFTTDLPEGQGLSLDASVQSEMTASWDDTINNGEYRIEWKEEEPDTETSYSNGTTVDEATTAYTIADLLDGEKYSVRLRTQTAFKTGSWLEAADITKLVAADQPTISGSTATSIDLSWVRNSDFEGSQPIYRKRTDYSYPDGSLGQLVGTASATATSYTDDTAQPDREYTYRVRALTQWVHADSQPSEATVADGVGLEDRAVPPRGWALEVDHPGGTTLTPDPLEGANRQPTINGFPRAEAPVDYREKWHSDAFDDADLRVWHDGDRLPIETLEHRSLEEGSGSKQTVLGGRGGTQLDNRVVEDVDVQPTHEFVRDLLEKYTDYQYTIDDPDTDQEERVLQFADTDVELQQALAEIPTDTPGEVRDGLAVPYKTAFTSYTDVESGDGGELAYDDFYDGDKYINGRAAALDAGGDTISYSFDLEYEMTEPEIWFYYDIPGSSGDDHHGFGIQVDDETIITANVGVLGDGGTEDWQVFEGQLDPLAPGEHTIKFQRPAADPDYDGDVEVRIDIAGIVDGRYNYTRDHTLNEPGGHIPGPEEYPDLVPLELTEITTPLSISEVMLDVESDDGGVLPELGIGVDGTDDYDTVTDALSHSLTYSELATTARAQIGVGRDPDATRSDQTPTQGFEPRGLDSLELRAVLDDTPVLTNRTFDGNLIDVLREVAKIGNFVFEVQESDGTLSVEWTQLGQRPVSIDPEIADYSVDRQTEDVVERAIVYGGAARITRQTVDVAIGEWVDLPFPDSKIVDGKETIYNSSSETEFTRGEDYEVRYATPEGQPRIRGLSDGALTDGQTVQVDADVKPRGSYTEGDAGENPKTITEDIPGLASKQMCDQVALYSVERTGDAIIDASVTISTDSPEVSLVDAIDIGRLPGEGPWEVSDISPGDGEVSVELGNGPSAEDFLDRVDSRTKRNSERV